MIFWGWFLNLFLILSLCVACEPSPLKKHGDVRSNKSGQDLNVVYFFPQGEVEPQSTILVHFSHPIVSEKEMGQRIIKPPFTIYPTINGTYSWLSPQTIAFYPEKRFLYSTDYEVVVSRTTQSLDGNILVNNFEWSFKTKPLQVTHIYPGLAQKYVAIDQEIFIQFNQPVPLAEVEAYTILRNGETKQNLPFRVMKVNEDQNMSPGMNPEYTFILKPKEAFLLDAKIELIILGKLRGIEGKYTLHHDVTSSFFVHGRFEKIALACSKGCLPTAPLLFKMDNPVRPEDFIKNVLIEPRPLREGDVIWDEKEGAMMWSPLLEEQTQYTIEISPDLKDVFDQKLGQKFTQPYQTSRLSYAVTGFDSLWDSSWSDFYPLRSLAPGTSLAGSKPCGLPRNLGSRACHTIDEIVQDDLMPLATSTDILNLFDPSTGQLREVNLLNHFEGNLKLFKNKTNHYLSYYLEQERRSFYDFETFKGGLNDHLVLSTFFNLNRELETYFYSSQKKIYIEPYLPAFAYEGDKMQVRVSVVNHSNEAKDMSVSTHVKDVEILGEKLNQVHVPAQSREDVFFTYEIPGAEEEVDFFFTAVSDIESDQLLVNLLVHKRFQTKNISMSGSTEDYVMKEIHKPQLRVAGQGQLTLSLSSSVLSTLEPQIMALMNYPYKTLNISMVQAYPAVLLKDHKNKLGIMEEDWLQCEKKLREFINQLSGYQHANGGFVNDLNFEDVDPLLTAEVALFLSQVLQTDYFVPPKIIDQLKGYLVETLNDDQVFLELKARLAYGLHALGEEVNPTMMDQLLNKGTKRSFEEWMLVCSLLAQNNPQDVRIENWLYEMGSQVRSVLQQKAIPSGQRVMMAQFLRLLLQINPQHVLVRELVDTLVEKSFSEQNIHPKEIGAMLQAFVLYDRLVSNEPIQFRAMIQNKNRAIMEAKFSSDNHHTEKRMLSFDEFGDHSEELIFRKEGEGRLYYSVALQYEVDPSDEVPVEKGIVVFKSVSPVEIKSNDALVLSESLYKVQLNLIFVNQSGLVVIDDPWPAGLAWHRDDDSDDTEALMGSRLLVPFIKTRTTQNGRLIIFADQVPPGLYHYNYHLRVATKGEYFMPSSRVVEMYRPEVFGITAAKRVFVE